MMTPLMLMCNLFTFFFIVITGTILSALICLYILNYISIPLMGLDFFPLNIVGLFSIPVIIIYVFIYGINVSYSAWKKVEID